MATQRLNFIIGGNARQFLGTLGTVRTAIGKIAGYLGVSIGAGMFAAAIKGASAWASTVDDMAKASNLSIGEVQKLSLVARQNGSNLEGAANSMRVMRNNLADAARRGGPARQALRAVGLGVKDLNGKSGTEQMGMIIDGLARVPDASKRTALAMDLFGKQSNMAMILASQGVGAFAAAMAKAEGTGAIASDSDIKLLADFNSQLEVIAQTLTSVFAQAIAPSIGAFSAALGDLQNNAAVLKDLRENLESIMHVMTAIAKVPGGLYKIGEFITGGKATKGAIGALSGAAELADRPDLRRIGVGLSGAGAVTPEELAAARAGRIAGVGPGVGPALSGVSAQPYFQPAYGLEELRRIAAAVETRLPAAGGA